MSHSQGLSPRAWVAGPGLGTAALSRYVRVRAFQRWHVAWASAATALAHSQSCHGPFGRFRKMRCRRSVIAGGVGAVQPGTCLTRVRRWGFVWCVPGAN